jgi:hypothetical protein
MPVPTAAALAQLDTWILEDIQRRNLNLLNDANPVPEKMKPAMMNPATETETEEAALRLALLLSRQEHEERERARQAQAAAVAEQRVLEGMFREARDREKASEWERAHDWEKTRAREKVRKIVEEERAREKAQRLLEEERAREKARKIMEEEEERMRREKMEGVKRVLERVVRAERMRGLDEERERERRKAAERLAQEVLEGRVQEERMRRRVRGDKGGKMDGIRVGEGMTPLRPGATDVRACVGGEDARRVPHADAGERGFTPEWAWNHDPAPYANGQPAREREFKREARGVPRWDVDLESDITEWPTEARDGRHWRKTTERRETVVRWDDEDDAFQRQRDVNRGAKRFV